MYIAFYYFCRFFLSSVFVFLIFVVDQASKQASKQHHTIHPSGTTTTMMATMLLRRSTIVVAPFQNRIPNNQLRRPFTCSSFVSSSRAREGTEGNRTSCASSKTPRPRWSAPLPYHRRSCFFSTVAVAASNSIDHAPAATTSESSNDPRPNVSVSDKPSSYVLQRRKGIRNVAVVAHVDHGKTTLVDQLLRLSARCVAAASQTGGATGGAGGSNSDPQVSSATASVDRVMDSGDLERERGITITSKATRMDFPGILGDEPLVVNCVDTPGTCVRTCVRAGALPTTAAAVCHTICMDDWSVFISLWIALELTLAPSGLPLWYALENFVVNFDLCSLLFRSFGLFR